MTARTAETAASPSAEDLAVLGVRPAVSPESAPFWEATERHELAVEQCTACLRHQFPGRGICRSCLSRQTRWVTVDSPAVVYSYTENHQPWLPGLSRYTLVIVELPEHDGLRFVGLLVGQDSPPEIGQLVGFGFTTALEGLSRLHFTPWEPR